MSESPEREARRALNRLRRALEKTIAGLDDVSGALRSAEGADFPTGEFEEAENNLASVLDFVEAQAERLEEKILHAGGLEPGRVRRTGGM